MRTSSRPAWTTTVRPGRAAVPELVERPARERVDDEQVSRRWRPEPGTGPGGSVSSPTNSVSNPTWSDAAQVVEAGRRAGPAGRRRVRGGPEAGGRRRAIGAGSGKRRWPAPRAVRSSYAPAGRQGIGRRGLGRFRHRVPGAGVDEQMDQYTSTASPRTDRERWRRVAAGRTPEPVRRGAAPRRTRAPGHGRPGCPGGCVKWLGRVTPSICSGVDPVEPQQWAVHW